MKMQRVSINKVINALASRFRTIGVQTVYGILLMVNAFKRKDTPAWAKRIIIGTLGYFLAPLDAVPDLAPIVGYTDDLGVVTFGLVTIAAYINNDVRIASRKQVKNLFGELDLEALQAIDQKL